MTGALSGWLRRFTQRRFEMPAFVRMLDEQSVDLRGKRLLDAGCGEGSSLRLLADSFAPSQLVGFDLAGQHLAQAQRAAPDAVVRAGDITAIDADDDAFDAVFVLGVLHHVPAWRVALSEIARVLVPSGVLVMEELNGRRVDFEDRFLGTDHPRQARFDWPTLRRGIDRAGLTVLSEQPVSCCTPIRWPPDGARAFLCRKSV